MNVTVTERDAGVRLDVFLVLSAGLTRNAAQRLIDAGRVMLNGTAASKSSLLSAGDEVAFEIPPPAVSEVLAQDIPLDIIYEDADIIVINKPKGMVVHPAAGNPDGTLVNALLWHCGDGLSGIGGVMRPGIVHRIDKDTSGLLVAAKNDASHQFLAAELKEHRVRRIYHAIVCGNLREDSGTIDAPVGRHPVDRKRMAVFSDTAHARTAVTHYSVLERFDGFTYLSLELETGRTHQIRVHMASKGHPLLGDTVYGGGRSKFERQNAALLCGQCLHAKELYLTHPVTREDMHFSSALPDYFLTILEKLK